MSPTTGEGLQTRLDLDARAWPSGARFPHNQRGNVQDVVWADLRRSRRPLLITGYASLEWIIDFLAEHADREDDGTSLRILIGFEPHLGRWGSRGPLKVDAMAEDVVEYWLDRGVSLQQAPNVLKALRALESRRVSVRGSGDGRVHAKIYVGDEAVTIGSSNFSRSGMRHQVEANVRFTCDEEERFAEARGLAEAIWQLGNNFKPRLRKLLEQLVANVTWPEALGRAVGEMLEGKWTRDLIANRSGEKRPRLWPSQDEGIGQAIWILENSGSVLVADATGSGKTRLGAGLIRALVDRNWRLGRARRDLPVLISPPSVKERWEAESNRWGQALNVYSQGMLSSGGADRRREVTTAVSRAQILAVDEAHNFLNPRSGRSRALAGPLADHVLLFTATPVNRSAEDLVAMVNLLGADNFEDEVLDVVDQVGRRRRSTGAAMSYAEVELIRGALSQFVVRRTKAQLNAMVDRDPGAYRNADGVRCRFPDHRPLFFDTGETASDRRVAREIRRLARRLRGLINLRNPIQLPDFLRHQGVTEEQIMNQRLRSAPALAGWLVNSTLRSSRAALWEHLYGTASAAERFKLEGSFKAAETGDVISRLSEVSGHPPEWQLSIAPPEWLREPEEHARACAEEQQLYREIGDLCKKVSVRRLDARASLLFKLWQEGRKLLAFDRSLISLAFVRERLRTKGVPEDDLLLARGNPGSKKKLTEAFRLGSTSARAIGLCSDAVSEALNLQEASALVHLDLPTVIRTLEQRAGRIDRMDSPHQSIDVHWPRNSPEFGLRSDDRLHERHRLVEELLGSNVPWPEDPESDEGEGPEDSDVIQTEDFVQSLETRARQEHWDGLKDAFEQLRGLVSGDRPLVPPDVYRAVGKARARVVSTVSVVEAHEEWSLFAVSGAGGGVPRWVFLDRDRITIDLNAIPDLIRERLGPDTPSRPFDSNASDTLAAALDRLRTLERDLLPRRKSRALDEMSVVLGAYRKRASGHRARVIDGLLGALSATRSEESVDLGRLSDWWLDQIRPTWVEYMSSRRRRSVARIKSIRGRLKKAPLSDAALETGLRQIVAVPSPDRRVVAAVIGVAVASS